MGFIRSFESFAPPPRFEEGADPFTKVKIEESDEREGTYTLIETITLSPVDSNPAHPKTRSFTTDNATEEPGWYRIVWEDASADTFDAAPIYFPGTPVWAPSVGDVAALLRARTKVPGGEEAGTFNDETRPTGGAVERLIAKACKRVDTALSGLEPCNDALRMDAGEAAALYAAMLVEQSYFPEATTSGGTSFQSLNSLWKDNISTLTEAVGEICGGGGGEAVGGAGQTPVWYGDGRTIIGPLGPVW